MKYLIVGGNFDDDGGRESGYVRKLTEKIAEINITENQDFGYNCINGGDYDHLELFIKNGKRLKEFDVVIWMANIPNDFPKLVKQLKVEHPHCLLVISKNNIEGKYKPIDMVGRALDVKANLLIEFSKMADAVAATVLDPLGNSYCRNTPNIKTLAEILYARLTDLKQFTRVGSKQVGDAIPCDNVSGHYFSLLEFIGHNLHDFVHGANPSRFLGNTSFRCTSGFPSIRRQNDLIFVSKRNVDKREMKADNFVAVDLNSDKVVNYYGNNKPSVDTPIQLELYRRYPNVMYMLHTHAYIEGAPFTQGIPIPCGSLEEANAIWELYPWQKASSFAVNLKGHGSIMFMKDYNEMVGINYVARPMLEHQPYK